MPRPFHARLLVLLLAGLALGAQQQAAAQPAAGQPITPDGWITDAADVLSAAEEARLAQLLEQHARQTTVQIAGVTVPSLDGRSADDYSLALAQAWGVGRRGVNNGALVLIAPSERAVRIQTGYGLYWQISDSVAAAAVERMMPALREGTYADALERSFEHLIEHTRGVPWKVRYESLERAAQQGAAAQGVVVAFHAQIRQTEGALRAVTVSGTSATLRVSPYMTVPSTSDAVQIYARLRSVQPLVLNVLGIEDPAR